VPSDEPRVTNYLRPDGDPILHVSLINSLINEPTAVRW